MSERVPFAVPSAGHSLGARLCYAVSHRLISRRVISHTKQQEQASFDPKAYQAWRDAELRRQFTTYFSASDVVGVDVLDFGCGHGELSFFVAAIGAKSVTGIEALPERFEAAVAEVAQRQPERPPRFLLATDACKIDLPDQSVDVILCFDVLEHIMNYREILLEWRRILRSDGRVLIWWVPWLNPYGPHIQYLVPIPWCHVIFSEQTLVDACGMMYDSPAYKPRLWDLDEHGQKLPNPWIGKSSLPNVNKLSIGRFEALCQENGLEILSREIKGFGSARTLKGWKRLVGVATEPLLRIPVLRELCTLHMTYRLRKV